MAKKVEIKGLFYITHVETLLSILRHGILAHALVEAKKISARERGIDPKFLNQSYLLASKE